MNRASLDILLTEMQLKAADILGASGLEIIDIEWVGSEQIFRIFISHENGVTHDHCILISKWIDENLDLDSRISSEYRLEVSSPGEQRPLRTARHFASFCGQPVLVTLTEPIDGRRKAQGSIASVDETSGNISLEVEGKPWVFPLDRLLKARLLPRQN